jgi:hypothetical protein
MRIGLHLVILSCLLLHTLAKQTINAYGNNKRWPSRGAAGSTFSRASGLAFFEDGISQVQSANLPNARTVSNNLFGARPFIYNRMSAAFMNAAWGQFVGKLP